jgi:hypothetical protein
MTSVEERSSMQDAQQRFDEVLNVFRLNQNITPTA